MQRRKWRQWANVVLAVFLAIPLSGCDSAVSEAVQSRVSDEELLPRVAAMIDAELPVIRDYVGDELDSERSLESVTGAEVVEQTLQEQNGRAYIEFSYGVQASESEEDGEELLRQSRQLLSDEAYQELEGRIAEKRMALMAEGESVAKDLAPSMQKAFYKDLQTVVVKSVVLLTAGAVYPPCRLVGEDRRGRRGRGRRRGGGRLDHVPLSLLSFRRNEGAGVQRVAVQRHHRAEERLPGRLQHDQHR